MGLYSLLEEGAGVLYQRLASGPWSARWAWLRERLRWFFNLKTPIALVAAGALYYVPFALSHSRAHSDTGLYMVFRENVVRFFEPFDHRGPVYLYLYVIFGLMAPWSVFIPAALLEVHRKARSAAARALADADLFALVYFWGTLAFFTLSRSRRSYYLLPILPAAALLVARLLSERAALWPPARRLLNLGYCALAGAVIGFGIGFLLPVSMRPGWLHLLPPSPARSIFVTGWLISLGTIWYAWRGLSVRRIAVSTAIITYLALFFLFIVLMPRAEAYRYERSFARAVRTNVGADVGQLAFFRIWGPGLVYYLSMPDPIPLFNSTEQVAGFAHRQGGAWVITRAKDVENLKLDSQIRAAEPEISWDSPSEKGSRRVLLRVR
jgi:4-amino-4-deoxy-L-arabinose transferase-like glycosyltransferase